MTKEKMLEKVGTSEEEEEKKAKTKQDTGMGAMCAQLPSRIQKWGTAGAHEPVSEFLLCF